ncbi:hypothetical protein SHKM778_32560 [Streptomyces sp. KM77-8]|uniref:Luciferase-like domain-containing protein n=1 Tax=Streptomyces haneummycinicus TaxID=3074435 RepID=A0AAT9HHA5_9ACTN
MRFGLIYHHQLPRPWQQDSEERLFNEALEQIELADRLGLDYAWATEHHFLEEYSHSGAPEVFLGAAAARTRDIRLAHGIVQLPSAVNHPVRVAERLATLDLISGGRVDFGSGAGSSQMELAAFGVERATKKEEWAESLEVVTRLLSEAPFTGHKGRFTELPPRNLLPKPKQTPHPPLWMACSARTTIEDAARAGLGALSFSFVSPRRPRAGSTPTTGPSSPSSACRSGALSTPTSPSCCPSCATRTRTRPSTAVWTAPTSFRTR